jgi:hypothetical protein
MGPADGNAPARVRLAPGGSAPDARPVEDLAAELLSARRASLVGAAGVLNDYATRQRLLDAVVPALRQRGRLRVRARDSGLSGLTLEIALEKGRPVMDVTLGSDPDLQALYHPLAGALPVVGDDHCVVATRPCAEAAFVYLDRDLVGPRPARHGHAREWLLRYLGRVIDADQQPDPLMRRYVEPGVGRAYLVDFVRFRDRPEFRDFSVTGIGLTPFAAGGFFFSGPHIDGHMPLVRARHRLDLAAELGAVGCRVPAVAAIITSPELEHTMPDHTTLPAALLVRGFRSVLRVKQLDPLANVLMSAGTWPGVQTLLQAGHWTSDPRLRGGSLGNGNGRHARPGVCTCLIPSFFLGVRIGRRCEDASNCRRQRIAVLREYAPTLLMLVRARLTEELGRDPESEIVSSAEYANWFAASLGEQLAAMRRIRFLHDYRVVQTEWDDPYDLLNSLTDTNVTLLAEFADLDTGVLVDRAESSWSEALRIPPVAWRTLRDNYDELHANEVRIARGIAQTVAIAAGQRPAAAAATFTAAYDRALTLAPPARRHSPSMIATVA